MLLLWIGLCLIIGYYSGLLATKVGLPKVSGYIFAGILLSPDVTGLMPLHLIASSEPIVVFSLSIITFMIGGSLKWDVIKKLGKSILYIAIAEASFAFLVVTIGMFFFSNYINSSILSCLCFALLVGALASPTDP
ncbi:MAG: hypothetical protein D6828_02250, partial [Nitrospirae bacterium]